MTKPTKRMMKRNRFLHDLKLCQAQAKEAKANGAEMLSSAYDKTVSAYLTHYSGNSKVILK